MVIVVVVVTVAPPPKSLVHFLVQTYSTEGEIEAAPGVGHAADAGGGSSGDAAADAPGGSILGDTADGGTGGGRYGGRGEGGEDAQDVGLANGFGATSFTFVSVPRMPR